MILPINIRVYVYIYIYMYMLPPTSTPQMCSISAFMLFRTIEFQLADDQRYYGQCDKKDSSNAYVSYSFGLLIDQMGYGQ